MKTDMTNDILNEVSFSAWLPVDNGSYIWRSETDFNDTYTWGIWPSASQYVYTMFKYIYTMTIKDLG